MGSRKDVHPEAIFEAMLAKSSRPQRAKNLKLLHEICSAQYKGAKDFSLGSIGRICEAAGGLKRRALYNAASADYRTLIQAWQDFAGVEVAKPLAAPGPSGPAFVESIHDPAIRALVYGIIVERDRLRGEVSLLKSVTIVQVDRRPPMPPAAPISESSKGAAQQLLSPSERLELERAISSEFLHDEGWSLGPLGEVNNAKGRTVYGVGYVRGIRKILK